MPVASVCTVLIRISRLKSYTLQWYDCYDAAIARASCRAYDDHAMSHRNEVGGHMQSRSSQCDVSQACLILGVNYVGCFGQERTQGHLQIMRC